ncbi:aminotransferase class I/II-fold pyridoxal phosphate-dependent enzyme [Ktedonobacter robiniae]|uniref:HTH gntR-type domain-containing protein n=1 Tax=Ktedonobacter robiniae TaxID=2778365 RepID=A0ABQ3V807_9CHLR|nr:aminotransferase class I/II-fold pyridoxal phosphate-dependent enzyme [Ktedonobacter robiniae]GHO60902.1 hypothetical protein KSB_93770 [Ktedonobacter robiniae]
MAKRRHRVPQIAADIALNRALSKPLHRQLYDRLCRAILNRQLPPGQRLPSTRDLANELRISRNTASNAYEQLCAEGYIERRVGHGTWVACELPEPFFFTHESRQESASLLREAIASHVSISRGVHCQAEQVLIVPGAQTALDMAARILLNPGELAWIEDPGYPGTQQALRNAGAHHVWVLLERSAWEYSRRMRKNKETCKR